MKRPDWFPDWRGKAAAIVASGPSTKKTDVALLQGRILTIAIKENSEIMPWADVVYGCDRAWWRNEQGLPRHRGLRVTGNGVAAHEWSGLNLVKVDGPNDRLLTAEPGVIGSGGNSGFQALNLAIQFGATRILLLGFDMSGKHGQHWYGPNKGDGRTNPGPWNFTRWRKAFEVAAVRLPPMNIEVRNASALSSLTCFPKTTVAAALEDWGS